MSDSRRKPVTYADLEALPPQFVGEIINGELYASPRPASRHARVATILGEQLVGPFDRGRGGPGGWWLLVEPEVHLGDQVLVPDWAGWRRERMPTLSDVPYFSISPDWVCEILSPGTSKADWTRKLPHYAQHGVRHAWIADPEHRSLQVFRLAAQQWILVGAFSGEKVRAEPFEAMELELDALWLPSP